MEEAATIVLGRASRGTIGRQRLERWTNRKVVKKGQNTFQRRSYRLKRTDGIYIKFKTHFIANNIEINFR